MNKELLCDSVAANYVVPFYVAHRNAYSLELVC